MITFGRMIPNAGYQARYRREMQKMIQPMYEETLTEVTELHTSEFARDAKLTLTKLMAMLRKKWYKIFERRAKDIARWLVNTIGHRTKEATMQQLKKIGFLIKPQYTDTMKDFATELIANNVSLIKSIPQKFLRRVQRIVREAWLRGGDRQYIYERIRKLVDKAKYNADRRAYLIAKDQMNKITQGMALQNAIAYGATGGEWIHVPGEFSSRETHIHMDRQRFDLTVGIYDPAVKKNVLPAELPYCACQFRALFPGSE